MSKLKTQDLQIYYGKNHAVRDVTLGIPDNQITAFIGPSGCGKSTLLRIIAGFEAPSGGRVQINGKAVKGPSSDHIFVFQQGIDDLWNEFFSLACMKAGRCSPVMPSAAKAGEQQAGVYIAIRIKNAMPHADGDNLLVLVLIANSYMDK